MPSTLLDYFPDDYLLFVDESHVTLPQVRGMYGGDRARKENLVQYGFRLPSAFDNRRLILRNFMPTSIRQYLYRLRPVSLKRTTRRRCRAGNKTYGAA
ncbi:MAG: hypothetical protein ACLR56_07495 [Oscillospiraceae bacterium]